MLTGRVFSPTVVILAAALLAACGGDADRQATTTTTSEQARADLAGVKDYLLDFTEQLTIEAEKLKANAEAYYALAKGANFDYDALLEADRDSVRSLVLEGQRGFTAANPAYERMEGVVAGVPELADYDVIIDAGGDASDPENAVPFSLKTPAGKTYKQPGNYNYLIETALWGTDERFAAPGVSPDLDGDGDVRFGEAMPDADFYVTAARSFAETTRELDRAAKAWEPTLGDALTALVVMTPTMSEYFEAWKSSRFVAGAKATENAFVAASRLQDIADILSGLVTVYENVEPAIAAADPQQAAQTGASLQRLQRFAADLRDRERAGRRYTAQDADTLGSQAQRRAEAIAGQVSQAAKTLNVELES